MAVNSIKMNAADAKKYLQRIEYKGDTTDINPTLEVLKSLCRAHVLAVPYSNAGLFSGKDLSVNLSEIYKKVVDTYDGGTCIELNALFGWLLAYLGFSVCNGQGRFYIENEFSVPFHHLTPVVLFENGDEWLCDVGWKMLEPVKIEMNKAQIQRCGVFRIRKSDEDNWIYLEKLRKTILDKDGKVLQQGPVQEDWVDIKIDFFEELTDTEWKIWRPICKFTTKHHELFEFQHMIDLWNNDQTSDLQLYLFHHKFTTEGMYQLDTDEFTVIRHVNPIIDQVMEKHHVANDVDAEKLLKKHYEHELPFKLQYFSKRHKK